MTDFSEYSRSSEEVMDVVEGWGKFGLVFVSGLN